MRNTDQEEILKTLQSKVNIQYTLNNNSSNDNSRIQAIRPHNFTTESQFRITQAMKSSKTIQMKISETLQEKVTITLITDNRHPFYAPSRGNI